MWNSTTTNMAPVNTLLSVLTVMNEPRQNATYKGRSVEHISAGSSTSRYKKKSEHPTFKNKELQRRSPAKKKWTQKTQIPRPDGARNKTIESYAGKKVSGHRVPKLGAPNDNHAAASTSRVQHAFNATVEQNQSASNLNRSPKNHTAPELARCKSLLDDLANNKSTMFYSSQLAEQAKQLAIKLDEQGKSKESGEIFQYEASDEPHSRTKRGWFGSVDEEKLGSSIAGNLDPYVDNITVALLDAFQQPVDNIEKKVSNVTDHAKGVIDSISGRVGVMEDLVENVTGSVFITIGKLMTKADRMESMVKNTTDDAENLSDFVRTTLEGSKNDLKALLMISMIFTSVAGISILGFLGCQCRNKRGVLSLSLNQKEFNDRQKDTLQFARHLLTAMNEETEISYKIDKSGNKHSVTITPSSVVMQAILAVAYDRTHQSSIAVPGEETGGLGQNDSPV